MVSQPSAVVQQLRQQIYYALDNDLLQNALFLAGRYHGLDSRNADAAHLLALCELKMGHLQAAYDCSRDSALKPKPHLGCAYIFAQACLGLEVYADGITALERSRGLWAARNHWSKSGGHARTCNREEAGETNSLPQTSTLTCRGSISRTPLSSPVF